VSNSDKIDDTNRMIELQNRLRRQEAQRLERERKAAEAAEAERKAKEQADRDQGGK